MKRRLWSMGEFKEKSVNGLYLTKFHYSIIFLFSIIFYFSLGFGEIRNFTYSASIEPFGSDSGPVKVVFYNSQYEDYLAFGALNIPARGWKVSTASDSTTLTAEGSAAPLVIYSENEPITFGLIHHPGAGVVRVTDNNRVVQQISLSANSEYVSPRTIGERASNLNDPRGVTYKYSTAARTGIFLSLLLLLFLIAKIQLRDTVNGSRQLSSVGWGEVVCYAIPLIASTTLVLLAYWPGNVAYDGSLQWYQAITRGNIDEPLGISATLFLRLFTHLSASPAWVVVAQSSLSAFGVALILRELRFRGVPRFAGQAISVLLAVQPQYPLFFTNLGKDALSAVGLLFFVWSLLQITRTNEIGRSRYPSFFVFIGSAVFAGMMRVNVVPAVSCTVLALSVYLFIRRQRIEGITLLVGFILGAVFIPKVSFFLSDEQQTLPVPSIELVSSEAKTDLQNKELPLGLGANFYIYHLFSAAVNSGIPLNQTDAQLFFKIAPQRSWAKYDCFMTDTTFIGVSDGMLLSQSQYHSYLITHQLDLANAVFNIIKNNPSILLNRQACISSMLWFIGYKKKPFQATSTLGYDNVTSEFKDIAGESRSLVFENIRSAIQMYVSWSETKSNFWFFWKPALMLYMGLFCTLSCLAVRRDIGLILMLSLPIVMTCVLAIVIPFPAYRYAYPAVLLTSLLCTLGFVSPTRRISAS